MLWFANAWQRKRIYMAIIGGLGCLIFIDFWSTKGTIFLLALWLTRVRLRTLDPQTHQEPLNGIGGNEMHVCLLFSRSVTAMKVCKIGTRRIQRFKTYLRNGFTCRYDLITIIVVLGACEEVPTIDFGLYGYNCSYGYVCTIQQAAFFTTLYLVKWQIILRFLHMKFMGIGKEKEPISILNKCCPNS